jgi:flagellar biosynthesis protein FlhF
MNANTANVHTASPKLFVKSYFTSSVGEGMAQARTDLGPDALLLNTRESPPEARHLGEYEVVFGVAPAVRKPLATATATAAAEGVQDLRQRIDRVRDLMSRVARPNRLSAPAPTGDLLEEVLVDAGVDLEMARRIGESARQRASARTPIEMGRRRPAEPDAEAVFSAARDEINSRFEVAPKLERVSALIGPPGSGKTTTIVKLAVAHGLAAGRPVHLLSIDHYRIGAVEQLRSYAAILGVPFQSCETTVALAHAISAAPADALVLVDTPGYSRAALAESGADLAGFLSSRQDIDTHLVLTASMSPRQQRRIADGFMEFRPSKLLFTRLDETDAYGSMFCEAARRKLPLSFVTAGQSIPEDLAAASKQLIADSLAHELPKAVRAVA